MPENNAIGNKSQEEKTLEMVDLLRSKISQWYGKDNYFARVNGRHKVSVHFNDDGLKGYIEEYVALDPNIPVFESSKDMVLLMNQEASSIPDDTQLEAIRNLYDDFKYKQRGQVISGNEFNLGVIFYADNKSYLRKLKDHIFPMKDRSKVLENIQKQIPEENIDELVLLTDIEKNIMKKQSRNELTYFFNNESVEEKTLFSEQNKNYSLKNIKFKQIKGSNGFGLYLKKNQINLVPDDYGFRQQGIISVYKITSVEELGNKVVLKNHKFTNK